MYKFSRNSICPLSHDGAFSGHIKCDHDCISRYWFPQRRYVEKYQYCQCFDFTSKSFLNLKAVSHSGVFWVYCFLKIRVYVLLTPEALVMVEAEEPKLFSTWCLWRTHICVSWKGFCFCSIHRLHGFFISNAFFNSPSVFLTDNYMQLNLII